MTTKECWTGWCEVGNHHICHEIYASRQEDVTYVCPCPCHQPVRVVKRVLRGPKQ
jgi:hypothetical protein